jgi:hypothetical protein
VTTREQHLSVQNKGDAEGVKPGITALEGMASYSKVVLTVLSGPRAWLSLRPSRARLTAGPKIPAIHTTSSRLGQMLAKKAQHIRLTAAGRIDRRRGGRVGRRPEGCRTRGHRLRRRLWSGWTVGGTGRDWRVRGAWGGASVGGGGGGGGVGGAGGGGAGGVPGGGVPGDEIPL